MDFGGKSWGQPNESRKPRLLDQVQQYSTIFNNMGQTAILVLCWPFPKVIDQVRQRIAFGGISRKRKIA
jgi:D-mannonate dehydratase